MWDRQTTGSNSSFPAAMVLCMIALFQDLGQWILMNLILLLLLLAPIKDMRFHLPPRAVKSPLPTSNFTSCLSRLAGGAINSSEKRNWCSENELLKRWPVGQPWWSYKQMPGGNVVLFWVVTCRSEWDSLVLLATSTVAPQGLSHKSRKLLTPKGSVNAHVYIDAMRVLSWGGEGGVLNEFKTWKQILAGF